MILLAAGVWLYLLIAVFVCALVCVLFRNADERRFGVRSTDPMDWVLCATVSVIWPVALLLLGIGALAGHLYRWMVGE